MTSPDPRLQNPVLGEPFTTRNDPFTKKPAPEIQVPQGWSFYFVPQGVNDPPWKHRRPEWTPYQHWAKQFVTFGTMRAGLMQRIKVNPGERFTLTVDACFTAQEAGIALRVGIDPMGGGDHQSSNVVWGEFQGETSQGVNRWTGGLANPRTLSCPTVESAGPYITVFLHSENIYAGKDASAFWDTATLWKFEDTTPNPDTPPNGDFADLIQAIRDQTVVLREIRDRMPAPAPTWEQQ